MSKETGSIPVLPTIRAKLPSLTRVQQRIGRYVLHNPEGVYKMTISELAEATGAKSESTIVRFYRTLGFSAYHDFKVTLATEIAGKSFYHTYEDITLDDEVATIVRKIFRGTIRTLDENETLVDAGRIEATVTALDSSRRVFLLGFASSAALAYDAYFKFTALGLNCHWCADSHMSAVLLSDPEPGDVVFAISQSGESRDLVYLAERVKGVATVVALTGYPESHLGRIADICLSAVSEEMNYRSDAIVSRILQSTIIGALFAALSVRRGEDAQKRLVAYRHAVSYLKY